MCAIFTGNNLIKLDRVDSTNSYLSSLAATKKLDDGTVVIAKHQYAGKGQRENFWRAEEDKNLTFSIVYYPTLININKLFLLTQAIALGVFDYLTTQCKNVKVKWPNDLFVGDKKIGGILIENTIKGDSIAQVVIGIGINVNQEIFDITLNKATSIFLQNEIKYNLDDELFSILSCVEHRYLQWTHGQFHLLKLQYIEVLYLYEKWHEYTLPNGDFLNGKIIGIEDNGQLLVKNNAGIVFSFGNKEIVF